MEIWSKIWYLYKNVNWFCITTCPFKYIEKQNIKWLHAKYDSHDKIVNLDVKFINVIQI